MPPASSLTVCLSLSFFVSLYLYLYLCIFECLLPVAAAVVELLCSCTSNRQHFLCFALVLYMVFICIFFRPDLRLEIFAARSPFYHTTFTCILALYLTRRVSVCVCVSLCVCVCVCVCVYGLPLAKGRVLGSDTPTTQRAIAALATKRDNAR